MPLQFDNNRVLGELDRILGDADNGYTSARDIPSSDRLTYSNGFYVSCGVIFIDIRGSSSLPEKHTRPVLAKLYRAYVSAMIRCIKSSSLHRHIRVIGDSVMGILNISNPSTDINELFELAGYMSSTIEMLNRRLVSRDYSPIEVGIGISSGDALMIKAGAYGTGENEILWMGRPINHASKLCSKGNRDRTQGDRRVMVSSNVYSRLKPLYQSFLAYSAQNACYTGDIVNIQTQQFLTQLPVAGLRSALLGTASLPTSNALRDLASSLYPNDVPTSPRLPFTGFGLGLSNVNSARSVLENYNGRRTRLPDDD